ncbi:type I phosphomannose isomerase catalytic subunit [Aequorivita echinoideorum]|uniref:Phosphohexomutase n=1 Tax=Aequorivita echinoideorum TaxID=1549647 RepID=A0ABS5S546_9FLAO|nr:type I phosphomannose isomerase catalytic subunit [Aequorivita echinoideorum]MBT0608346.1 class I mannose-6-phosphate isomerase [Aequorivita echinoideorum]
MKQSDFYPIKFEPILKEKIWGGNKLKTYFNKNANNTIGESWEISGVEGNISIIKNGKFSGRDLRWLLKNFKEAVVGKKVFDKFGTTFPLLFKFIDAHEDLSVQLHPNDELAALRHNAFGKTEMWYILHAEENSRLILGFNQKMTKEKYQNALSAHKITEILHSENVNNGDAFFISPGTVHAIGSGIVLAEIQQTSDITYRIYDWDRPDASGNLRELHTDLALQAIDFFNKKSKLDYVTKENEPSKIISSKYFEINMLQLKQNISVDCSRRDSFSVYMCAEGNATITVNGIAESIESGETMLIPAACTEVGIATSSVKLLEVYIP